MSSPYSTYSLYYVYYLYNSCSSGDDAAAAAACPPSSPLSKGEIITTLSVLSWLLFVLVAVYAVFHLSEGTTDYVENRRSYKGTGYICNVRGREGAFNAPGALNTAPRRRYPGVIACASNK
ncbi:unnamed protein product [Cuscuta campestris]|uniref:Uncharacterized protein n=1 Tax=Cuscuta campestris TaxID=132261 RepID=A0A484KQA4_9ASTE|nr:unnamed protein product [Cuscuta campestris]